MGEVNDELMTPGCPQCAVKHLSAALYHRAKMPDPTMEAVSSPYMTCVCTAYINLVEAKAGYRSHLWYAVGALARAEELVAPRTVGCVARMARLMLEERGIDALSDALECIQAGTVPNHADWAAAHFDEAVRELPAFAAKMRMDDLIGSIERIRDEYFNLEEAPVASNEDAEEGGECDMATKKAMKAPAKAACKAACKGGKTAKAACKGGKCKK